jgi:AcrR family transcriptional regulator
LVPNRVRATREQRQKRIAEVTLKLVAKYGVQGATISRIASGVGLTRSALYKFFPNREAMLEAALDLLVERVPKWIDESSGNDVFEHLMDMGRQHAPLGRAEFESFTRPWFQFIAGSSEEHMKNELAKRQLGFVRDFAVLIEQGKRDGSIREDADSSLIAWSLMMWAWAADVARLIGLEQTMGPDTCIEIFKRMLRDIAGPYYSDEAAFPDEREVPEDMVSMGHELTRRGDERCRRTMTKLL